MLIGMSNDHARTHSDVACFIDQQNTSRYPVSAIRIIIQGFGRADADPPDLVQGERFVIVVLLKRIDVDLEW